MDSGASERVVSEDMISSAEIKQGLASKRGVQYEVANGVRIPNLGEKRFVATSEEGIRRQITAQVCEVNKGLLSVRRMAQADNTVVFTKRAAISKIIKLGSVCIWRRRMACICLNYGLARRMPQVFKGRA